MKKRILSVMCLSLVTINLFGFIRVDYGVEIGKGSKESIIYKSATMEESDMNASGFTMGDIEGKLGNIIQNSKAEYENWNLVNVDETDVSGRIHTVGKRYQTTAKARGVEYQVWAAIHDMSDLKYRTSRTLFTKTVNVKVYPNWLSKGVYKDGFYGETSDIADYYFVITTPGEIVSSNGTVNADKTRVEWNIEDQLRVKTEEQNLTVTYKDYSLVKYFIIAGLVIIAVIVASVIKNMQLKNKVVVDDENTYSSIPKPMERPRDEEHFDPFNNTRPSVDNGRPMTYNGLPDIKCPECGNMIKGGDNFCDKCGRFL